MHGECQVTNRSKQGIDAILHPASIAVVGVSENRGSPGSLIYRSIQGMGFEGALYPVNRRGLHGNGEPCFHSLSEIPESIDLVFVATPPASVPSIVQECVGLGVKGCVINSAGFSENTASEGSRLEREIVEALKDSSTRIIGPNCLGIYSSEGRVAFFDNMKPGRGGVSMISQSGSISTFSYYLGKEKNVPFSTIISSGNELDLNCSEWLDYFIQDPGTSIILAYLEELREPRKFLRLAREAHGVKPIIACKSGLTESGGRAARSHTGSLGGSRQIWEGAAAQSHLVLAEDLDQLMDLATLFTHLPAPRGRNIGIVSSPGGLAVIAADLAERYGFNVPLLSESSCAGLADILPGQGTSIANPVDLGFGALKPGVYRDALRILDRDESIDMIIALGGAPSSEAGDPLMFEYFTTEVLKVKQELSKPLLASLLPSIDMGPFLRQFHHDGIPAFHTLRAAFKTLSRFADYHLNGADKSPGGIR